ncbi:flagellar assembly factor FliW [Evansella caseinilytica]|uniref:Flagellar assembly factor FliW n=1 Tax=Evansella caseinilytica TaxID=1503961 RepID=A0A1H3S6Q9_9BACI|nr:flagellar assembly protein FliW [Evansella caseinilytica]SDZ33437.1 flagellar assembly factor FliW [Evansella caseinilytica]
MMIETKYSGTIDINRDNIIVFEQGIPSFEEEKEFILLPFSKSPSPLYILQSVNTTKLAFVVMTPFTFFPDYEAKLPDSVLEKLEIEKKEDVALFVILTIKETLEKSTANLRGPIVVNSKKQLGKQIILDNSAYHTKHQLPLAAAAPEKEGE